MPTQPKGKEVTFLLKPELLAEVKAIVREGPYRSINAFVEQALSELVQIIRYHSQ